MGWGCNFSTMVRAVSTQLAYACFLVLCISVSLGCIDPKSKIDDFIDRTPDVPKPPGCDGRIADITGQFLISIDPKPLEAGKFIRFIGDVTFASGANTVDLTIRPLDFETGQFVPDFDPLGFTGLQVDADGNFNVDLDTTIPGRANAVLPNVDVGVMGALAATIGGVDLFFGDVTGMTSLGSNLDGSTFGAIRIEEGTLGDALPDPVGECLIDMEVDAGPVDAGPVDAPAADAPAADAAATDGPGV